MAVPASLFNRENSLFSGNWGARGYCAPHPPPDFAATRCISEPELRNFNRLVLIFSVPRAHAREGSPERRRSFARRGIGSVDGWGQASL